MITLGVPDEILHVFEDGTPICSRVLKLVMLDTQLYWLGVSLMFKTASIFHNVCMNFS